MKRLRQKKQFKNAWNRIHADHVVQTLQKP